MIIFSELPKIEKMKYFNFLLENDITFKEDETGNYTALVKVFNPEYYQQKGNSKNNTDKNILHSEAIKSKSDPRHFRSNSVIGNLNKLSNEIGKVNEKPVKKVNINLNYLTAFLL